MADSNNPIKDGIKVGATIYGGKKVYQKIKSKKGGVKIDKDGVIEGEYREVASDDVVSSSGSGVSSSTTGGATTSGATETAASSSATETAASSSAAETAASSSAAETAASSSAAETVASSSAAETAASSSAIEGAAASSSTAGVTVVDGATYVTSTESLATTAATGTELTTTAATGTELATTAATGTELATTAATGTELATTAATGTELATTAATGTELATTAATGTELTTTAATGGSGSTLLSGSLVTPVTAAAAIIGVATFVGFDKLFIGPHAKQYINKIKNGVKNLRNVAPQFSTDYYSYTVGYSSIVKSYAYPKYVKTNPVSDCIKVDSLRSASGDINSLMGTINGLNFSTKVNTAKNNVHGDTISDNLDKLLAVYNEVTNYIEDLKHNIDAVISVSEDVKFKQVEDPDGGIKNVQDSGYSKTSGSGSGSSNYTIPTNFGGGNNESNTTTPGGMGEINVGPDFTIPKPTTNPTPTVVVNPTPDPTPNPKPTNPKPTNPKPTDSTPTDSTTTTDPTPTNGGDGINLRVDTTPTFGGVTGTGSGSFRRTSPLAKSFNNTGATLVSGTNGLSSFSKAGTKIDPVTGKTIIKPLVSKLSTNKVISTNTNPASTGASSSGAFLGTLLGLGALGVAGVAGARYIKDKKEQEDFNEDFEDDYSSDNEFGNIIGDSYNNDDKKSTTAYKAEGINTLDLDGLDDNDSNIKDELEFDGITENAPEKKSSAVLTDDLQAGTVNDLEIDSFDGDSSVSDASDDKTVLDFD